MAFKNYYFVFYVNVCRYMSCRNQMSRVICQVNFDMFIIKSCFDENGVSKFPISLIFIFNKSKHSELIYVT